MGKMDARDISFNLHLQRTVCLHCYLMHNQHQSASEMFSISYDTKITRCLKPSALGFGGLAQNTKAQGAMLSIEWEKVGKAQHFFLYSLQALRPHRAFGSHAGQCTGNTSLQQSLGPNSINKKCLRHLYCNLL